MRFTVDSQIERHKQACTSVAASLSGEIASGGDDFTVWRWNQNGEPISMVAELESCVTLVAWMPGSGARRGKDGSGVLLVGCADGTMRIVSASDGRVEKVVEAHTGAVSAAAFAPDGTTMVTAGEDGLLKVWSQAGVQRSVLANAGKCIYSLVWGTESAEMGGDCLLYAAGSDVFIKPLKPAMKRQLKWKAHKGVVLCVDWSRMSNTIVTGGEDGLYKVWDAYGRNIFTSAPTDYPVTSIQFSPDGEMFAVGTFLKLRICDKTGWTHCCDDVAQEPGSVMALSWTPDGTQVVCGGGSGALSIAQLVDRTYNWDKYTVTLSDSKRLLVRDVLNDLTEELDHRDKVIKVSIGHGHLVVCTTTQCASYDVNRFSTPAVFDLRDAVVTVEQCEKLFLLADCMQGISVCTYEGRLISTIKIAVNIRPEMVSTSHVSLSPDTIAVRDPANHKVIQFYDATSGKRLKDFGVTHHLDITELCLSQRGNQSERKVAFIDRNKDMYIAPLLATSSNLLVQSGPVATGPNAPPPEAVAAAGNVVSEKLATMVSSAKWHDEFETLVAISDGHLATWYLPSVVLVDRDLLANVKHLRDDDNGEHEFTANAIIHDFSSTRIGVRRGSDGALLTFGVSPYPSMLFAHIQRFDWEGAVRLCRFLGDPMLWSILACLAIRATELRTAGVAYSALGSLDKVRYIESVKEIPSPEGRQAELAVFARHLPEAEKVLLQAGLTYRAIDLHTRLYSWERALEIAVKHNAHIDTVRARRKQYLEAVGRKETISKFRQMDKEKDEAFKLDWTIIEEKVKQDIQKEKQRPNAKPYQ